MQGFQLSSQQGRLWSLMGGSCAFVSQCAFELDQGIGAEALRSALRKAVDRHEIFRTAFQQVPGWMLPAQVIDEEPRFELELEDAGEITGIAERLRAERAAAGSAPLRARLLTSPRQQLLLLTLPALCADGRTLRNLAEEIVADLAGEATYEDELIQYADFCEWQSELEQENAAPGRDYWKTHRLERALSLRLPLERQDDTAGPFSPEVFAYALSRTESADLAAVAQALGSDTGAILLSALQAWLCRVTETTETTVGHLCEGRRLEPLRGAMGLFSRFLPLRCRCERELPFAELVKEVEGGIASGAAWQESFVWDEAGAKPRFFPVCFEVAELPARPEPAAWFSCTDRFHLKLVHLRGPGFDTLEWHYDPARFESGSVLEIAKQYAALLAGALAGVEVPLARLPLANAAERHRFQIEWNDTGGRHGFVAAPRRFELQAARSPEAPALIAGLHEVSYAELNRRANRLARHLQRLGVAPGEVVALCLERSPRMVEALLAVWKTGAAYLALDPETSPALSRRLLSAAGARLALTQEKLAGALPFEGPRLCLDNGEIFDMENAGDLGIELSDSSPAYLAATSGTTGEPKLVLGHHGGISNYLSYLDDYQLGRGDRVLQLPALSFDASIRDLFGPLTRGAAVVLLEPSEAKSPAAIAERLHRHQVDAILSIVPTMLRALLNAVEGQPRPAGRPRLLLVSGEPLFRSDCDRARRLLNGTLAIVNQYGPTECTMTSTFAPIPFDGEGEEALPLGRPIPNACLLLLDDQLQPVPVGLTGEIFIGGAGLAHGYFGRPDLTAAAFVPASLGGAPGRRLYRTGDLGRLRPDGRLEYLGRRDRQVKVRGIRVEPEALEAALRQHPALRQAVVVARREDPFEVRLAAYLVSDREPAPSLDELRRSLLQSFPEAMQPSAWVFLPELPLTRTGKVDRSALPAPEEAAARSEAPFRAPRTPAEEILCDLWTELLKRERPSIDDSFFDLGGHSLLATQLVARARNAFQVDLPLQTLFEAPTIAGFAQRVEAALRWQSGASVPPIKPGSRSEEAPLSFAQQRHWLLHQLDPEGSLFNNGGGVRLTGDLDVLALRRSLDAILLRHEVLRTVYFPIGGQPVQRVLPASRAELPLIDLGGLPPGQAEVEAERLAELESERPFDLAASPLLRMLLLRLSDCEHVALLTMHHIVSDAWSIGILVRELGALYAAGSLADLPIQYRDYARWQRRWLQGEVLEGYVRYWRTKLAGAPPALRLHGHAAARSGRRRGGRHRLVIGPERAAAVRAFGRGRGATPFMTLLSAFKLLLRLHTGQHDICVGAPVSNRDQVETEGLIGCFINALALRSDLDGNPSFLEIVERVRRTVVEAYAHQDLPFEKLIEELNPDRLQSSPPLFNVVFNFQGALVSRIELGSVTASSYQVPAFKPVKYDLTLYVQEEEGRFGITLAYDADLLTPAAVAGLAADLDVLLGRVLEQPESRVADLDRWLSGARRERRLAQRSQVEDSRRSRIRETRRRSVGA